MPVPYLRGLESFIESLQSHSVFQDAARALLDGVIEKHPSIGSQIGTRLHLVINVAFKCTLCKVQNSMKHILNAAKRKSLQYLVILDPCPHMEANCLDNFRFAMRLSKRGRLSAVST